MEVSIRSHFLSVAVFLMHCVVHKASCEKGNTSPLHFTHFFYNATIYENSAPKTYVESYVKMGIYKKVPEWDIRYRIASGDNSGLFKTEEHVIGDFCFLRIRTRSSNTALLNREVKDSYMLIIKATESTLAYEAWAKVLIHILDRNDLKPLFSPPSYKVSIREDTPLKTVVNTLSATDADAGQNAEFYYALSTKSNLFTVHPTTGAVMVTGRLNSTHRGRHNLQVLAVDRMRKITEGNGFGNLASLTIQVEPSARKPPSISSVKVTSPDSDEDFIYATLSVESGDSEAGVDSVEFVDGDPGRHFKAIKSYFGSTEFMIVSNKEINWLLYPFGFNLSVQAKDKSKPPLFSPVRVVHIPPSKYVSARFEKEVYRVQLSEFSPAGSQVVMVKITPVVPNLKYILRPTPDSTSFKINPYTGLITTVRAMDFHEQSSFELEVTSSNSHTSTTVIVDIIDCNNHPPSFTQSSYHGAFDENVPPGTSVLTVRATDEDEGDNGFVTYSIANQKSVPFVIDPYSGVISTSKSMDYELMQRWYHLRVWASDWGSPFRHETEVYVSLTLSNVNDNAPVFEKASCSGTIPRDFPVGSPVATVSAIDSDELQHIKYEIKSGNELQHFELNPISGVISLRISLRDRPSEQPLFYSLKITATDGENYALPTSVNITVVSQGLPVKMQCEETGVLKQLTETIIHSIESQSQGHGQDDETSLNLHLINHNAPKFDDSFPRSIDIIETVPINSTIADLSATDPDTGFNGKLVYVISDGNDDSCFTIDLELGLLQILSPLDHEQTSFYILNITVYDLGTPQKSSWKLLAVNVLDTNDNTPKFTQAAYWVAIPEHVAAGTTIAQLKAEDADTDDNGRVKYSLLTPTDKFAVNSVTGEVTVTGALDRELWPCYVLKIEARDQPKTGFQLFSVTDLVVTLEDVNDNTPQCLPALNSVKVPEDLPVGTILLFLEAFDPDAGSGGEVRYSLINNEEMMFHVDKLTGALRLEKELDYEKRDSYNLTVQVSDGGKPSSRSSLCHLEVNVIDVNENLNPPRFASFVFKGWVQENSPKGTSVMMVTAKDIDRGKDGEVQYFLREGTGLSVFHIEKDTGTIRTIGSLDREGTSHYWLTVLALDLGTIPLSSVTEIYIEVTDTNDNPPQMSRPVFYASVMENSPPNTSVLQLDAFDPDSSSEGKLTFHILTGNPQGLFTINLSTGLISTTSRQLDREYKAEHILEVAVSDNGEPALKSSSRVVIQVLDANDSPPSFPHKLFMVQLPEREASETPLPVYRLIASDRDQGQNSQITYTIEEEEEGIFTINPTTGTVFSRKAFPASEYNILTVKATDGGSPPLSSHVRLHISWVARPGPSSEPLAFDEPHFNFAVMETDPVNHMVGVISIEMGPSQVWFNITGGDDDMDFDIEKSTGSMVIARPLDARKKSSYNLTVEVTDGSSTIKTQAFIHVIDINQHRPQFLQSHYEVRVPEDTPSGREILQVSATDKDKGKGLIYTIHGSVDPKSTRLFQLDPGNGVLTTAEGFSSQPMPQHTLTVMVRDQEVPIKRNFVRVIIHVDSCNLHPPQFSSIHYEAEVLDSAVVGTEVIQVRAFDQDQGANAEIHYSLQAGNGEGFFSIDPYSGIVTVAQKLDPSRQERFTLIVKAEDRGFPQLKDSATVHVHIRPSDRTPPKFLEAEYMTEISESTAIGSPLIQVSATSLSPVSYEIKDGNGDGVFSMNYQSGLISTQKNLDFEQVSFYQLKVRGTNMAGAFMDAVVLIYVIDENDNVPVFVKPSFVGWIIENAPAQSMVLDESNAPLVTYATDADQDSNALLIYEILEPEALKYFTVDPSTGTLTSRADIDYELTPVFHFSVHVHDSGSPSLFASKPAKVTIHVKDVNDSPPVFLKDTYDISVLLPAHPGMELLSVQAKDADSEVTYSIMEGNLDNAFHIHPLTGLISILNTSGLRSYQELTVRAGDGLYKSTALVKLNLTRAQGSSLKFDQDVYTATIMENSSDEKTLTILGVKGYQLNEPLSYSLLNEKERFKIIQASGVLQTKGVKFDREMQDMHEVAVEVKDSRKPPRVSQATVRVYVEDVNDNAPQFENVPYYASVQDGTEPGDVLFQVSATDKDIGDNGAVTYSFAEEYKYFRIDPYLGDISLKRPLDYQALNKYNLRVIAKDKGEPPLHAEEEVVISVRNRSNPLFQSLYYRVKVPENVPPYTSILHIQARSPEGLRLIYNIVEEDSLKFFNTDFKTGVLTVTGQLDYELETKHTFTVRATDTALGSFSEARVEVEVEDINDNPPIFSQIIYTASVSESLPPQTPVVQLFASDKDSGRNKVVSYQIMDDGSDAAKFFNIDASTGQITTAQALDYETNQQFRMKVRAADHGVPPLSSDALVIVDVTDINDNPPEFSQLQYEAKVSEMATCGHIVIKVQALDPDSGDTTRLEYVILSGNDNRHFAINSTSGIISMFNRCKKDLEPSYNLRVSASDGVFKSTVPVYINTTNANKYSPTFQQNVYEAELAENAEIGTKVIELLAIDPDGGPYGTIDYTIINKLAHEKFSIDNKGCIATLQKLDRENSTERVIAIKVMAKDGGGKVAFCTVKIILTDENDNPPLFKASEYTLSIQSNVSKGSPVIQVLAYDADEGANADVIYSVDSVEDVTEDLVEINAATGVVKVKESLIGLENRAFNFKVKAEDGRPPHWNSLVPVNLQIVPREVTLPRFSEPLYTFSASEDLPEGSEIGSVKAFAEDPIIYSLVKGTTTESNKDEVFTLDEQTGALKIKKPMDHETTKWYQVDVMAHCSHLETELVSLVSVNIQVQDVNDNRPVFEADPYRAFVMENMPSGTAVIQVTANDQDTGSAGQVTYSLEAESGNLRGLFTIDGESGWITTLKELDCEDQEIYRFYVVATDHGRKVQLSSQTLVEVTVSDENDNAPQFTSDFYKGSVIENAEPGQVVVTLSTIDADISEQNRRVTCYITEGDILGQFTVEQIEGEWTISSKKPLDREDTEKYLLKVVASDGKFQATTEVEIFVLDINDNSPECGQILYTGRVSEDAGPGLLILKISATDPDVGSNAQITYSLHGPGAEEFRLGPHTGELSTSAPLDREQKPTYHLVAKATDGGGRSCQADVTLIIEDTNDNAPRFFPSHCAVAVFDNTTTKTPIAVVAARDLDEGLNAEVVYSLSDSANGHFSIEETTGVIRLEKPLKDSQHSAFELTVCATDRGTPQPLSSLGTVTVSVVDLNEYLPVFLAPEYVAMVKEDVAVGTEVLNLSVLTRDNAENNEIKYEIVNGNDHGKFQLNSNTGALYINGSLDFEVSHEYYLSIEGTRKGSASLSDVTMVVINITDINDHAPEFIQDPYFTDIREDAAIGEIILTVSADDLDGSMNNQITYSIVEGNPLGHFAIQPKNGQISIAKHLDREEIPSYALTVRATDNGHPAQFSDVPVHIHVSDVNDNPPRFFQLNYSVVVQENAPVGTSVLELIMSDRDSPDNGPPYSFQITQGNDGKAFEVTQNGLLVTSSVLNRRMKEQYLLQVQVSDSGIPPLSSSAFINIQVTEQSQYAPSALPLEIFITTNEEAFRGGVLGKIHATDRDPHDTLVYTLVAQVPKEGLFSVGAADGKIIAGDKLPHGHYLLNVTVSDGTFTATTSVSVHVWCFTQEALDKAVVLHFRHLSPEEFVGDHWRNLQRFLGNILVTRRQNIHMASLQPAAASDGVDLLLAVGEPHGSLYEPRVLASKLTGSAGEMDQLVGLRMKKAIHVPCHGSDCAHRVCRETIQLDPGMMSTYSTARLSVLTPRHSLEQICSCNGTAVRFGGHSYIWYQHSQAGSWHMHFRLKTHQHHSVVFHANGSDHTTLEVVNGVPQLGYSCQGSSSGNLSSSRFVSDGEWHSVFLEVKNNSVRLLIDGLDNASLQLPGTCSISQGRRDLIFGGLRQPLQSQRVTRGFRGCLDVVAINGREVVLLPGKGQSKEVLEEVGIRQCCSPTGACSSNPCLNNGMCSETHGGGYTCICPGLFSGEHCELGDSPCESKPCLHGGTCSLSATGYSCHCPDWYLGERCEKLAEECQDNPCRNAGRCVSSRGSVHCICPPDYQGDYCTQPIITPAIVPTQWALGPEEIAEIAAGVLGAAILAAAFVLVRKRCRQRAKAHKPVAREDPDLLSKSEFSKSVGVGTQPVPPIELNILSDAPHNNLDRATPEQRKATGTPEFVTFNSANAPKHRGTIVCSVAPNLPPVAPPSNSDNESFIKCTWAREEMVYPAETTYWPPRYLSSDVQEYSHYEIIQGPPASSSHPPLPPPPPPPADTEPVALYGGFPFPLDQSNKRAPIPPRYSNQNLEDFLPLGPVDMGASQCQNEYTAISYYPAQLVQGEGVPYQPEPGYKRVSMRLSVAQPSYADCELGHQPSIRAQPLPPPNYEGSDMVESDYGSCEEVMF
ncbi:Protocadherin Fat 2 [Lonchura striata]|uniref:Protocadherin Fat 2 n=1 Tax=Lonchura striata TaxID=40157 RepID=A0A218V0H2_9PASE|nr:protocadherin Fat 2 [Lonchura striata domestica]OWK59504.1 Protocadherin Fat 2 [Lonchura striata domestica]